jgi:hypothetical protein
MNYVATPCWLIVLIPCAAIAARLFRCSVPLIFADDEYRPFRRLDRHLPVQGRWLCVLLGSLALGCSMVLAVFCVVTGMCWLWAMGTSTVWRGTP